MSLDKNGKHVRHERLDAQGHRPAGRNGNTIPPECSAEVKTVDSRESSVVALDSRVHRASRMSLPERARDL
jgi:hypothetical protein